MFSISTQHKYWMFNNEHELSRLRQEANRNFVEKHGTGMNEEARLQYFLHPTDESMACKQYEYALRDFCRKFHPPMPRAVVGTSFQYFKRFYLHNSVMDYHPKHIIVTCVYLACKVEEFNVSITHFVANVKGDREKAMDIILNNELLLMQQLNYHLTIHNPFRPVEGLLIDIKTRFAAGDIERLRPVIDDFLDRTFFTDVCLLYAPSQIALAAVLYAANKMQDNLESYVTDKLFGNSSPEMLQNIRTAVKKIWMLVKNIEYPPKDQLKIIKKKLEACMNQENNPDSHVYKRKMQEMLNDEEMESSMKYSRISEEQKRAEEELLNTTQFSESP